MYFSWSRNEVEFFDPVDMYDNFIKRDEHLLKSFECSEENWLILKKILNFGLDTSPWASNTSFILLFPEGASNMGGGVSGFNKSSG